MTEKLPAWVVVGAEALLVWGYQDESIERVSVIRVTPSGQVVVAGNSEYERRFMLRDFSADGTAHRYSGGSFGHSQRLIPLGDERAPRLLARGEGQAAWNRVRRSMDRFQAAEERGTGDPMQCATVLADALTAWRRARENLNALS